MYVFVGVTPRNLASGRPLVFGDTVDAAELTPEDESLKDQLVTELAPVATPEATEPEPTNSEA